MNNKEFYTKNLTESAMNRRSFLKWSGALGGAAVLASGPKVGLQTIEKASAAVESEGKWITAACWHNCSDNNSRCLLKAYVVDGVPQRVKSDDAVEIEDSIDIPQRRACPRGRAQIGQQFAADRLKFPMKRKNWEPGGGKKELRGKDEWVRISWDEAFDIAASETKRIIEKYGNKAIYNGGWGEYLDPLANVFNALGGYTSFFVSSSWGSWPYIQTFTEGTYFDSNDRMNLRDAKLILLVGANWAVNKGGNAAYYLRNAKEAGAKVIIIDPWFNQTAEGLADEWYPIIPGTDTAMFLGIAHYLITHDLYDQEFLDKYCSGFDSDHMPEGASKEDNFKDYVLGTYDGEPKTPQWASQKCGVHTDVIEHIAFQMGTVKPMTLISGYSTIKFPTGEQWGQVFNTVGWMTGNVGKPGACVAFVGPDPIYGTEALVKAGWRGDTIVPNPHGVKKWARKTADLTDENDWSALDWSQTWVNMLDGEYGTDSWPSGKRKVNIQMIAHTGQQFLNSMPNVNAGIKVHRQVEFVMATSIHFDTKARYADLVFPVTSRWERQGYVDATNREHVIWFQKVMEPLFEARDDVDVAIGIGERLGIDMAALFPSYEQREYNTVAGSTVALADGSGFESLVTITQEDIDAWGVVGTPQKGRITVEEFREQGIYRIPRKHHDKLTHIKHKKYIDNPEENPLATESGKLEIYCPTLERLGDMFGYSKVYPIGKWQEAQPDHGNHARSKDYPLLLHTPHTLRRAHTAFDNVPALREAFPQECHMSVVDAEERSIKTGDVVLMSSPYGKVLRRAKVLPGMVPGSVVLEDGAMVMIDEETGIDLAGNPNVLQAPAPSGLGSINWTATLLQVEKYEGDLELLPDSKWPARSFKLAEKDN